jgi:hypothetical protein
VSSGKDQTEAAWATKFSASNLKEYRDSFQSDQATESNLSDETDGEDDQIDREYFNADSQYIWHADDPPDDGPNVATGIEKWMTSRCPIYTLITCSCR